MQEFRDVLDECLLRDLGFKGNKFTWQRGSSPSTIIKERLDRFLATLQWCTLFPQAQVQNLPILNSDHGPILLTQDEGCSGGTGKRLKKFEAFWLADEGCSKVIEEAWSTHSSWNIPSRICVVLEKLTS